MSNSSQDGWSEAIPINAGTWRWVSLRSTHPTIDDRYSFAFSRRIAPEVCIFFRPSSNLEGAGKTGCLLHPRSRALFAHSKSCTRAYRAAGAFRPSLRNGFTAYFVLSPENGFFASVAARGVSPCATSRQHRGVRTTRLRRTFKARTSCAPLASIASHRAFVTMANAPHPP